MVKIKKVLNAKIISLVVAMVFFLNNAVYGIDAVTKPHLRVPVGEESTYRRLNEVVKTREDKRGVFTGTYTATINGKFRVRIPSKLLSKQLPIREIVLTFLNKDFIRIFYKDEWLEAVTRQAPSGSVLLAMRYNRIVFTSADYSRLDAQGSVLIPKKLQKQGIFEIGSKVILVGAGGFFELWPINTYQKPAEIKIPEAIEKDAIKTEDLAEEHKHRVSIDSKGRLMIPKKYIEKFEPGAALLLQPINEGAIRVFGKEKWIEAVNSEAPEELSARMLYKRNMFGSVFPTVVKIYKSRPKSYSLRFLIPEEVCNSIDFNKPGTVEFIDFGNYWEIRPVKTSSAHFSLKGWISKPEYLKWLDKSRNKIRELAGSEKGLIVYYYAIGGGLVKKPGIGTEDIDIVSPLLATDFTLLMGSDIARGEFDIFKLKVKKDLGSLEDVDPDSIVFDQGIERIDKDNYTFFTAEFTYLNKPRKIKVYYGMDAKRVHPDELKKGYNALYSRGNPGLILEMPKPVMSGLISYLVKDAGFIIMENIPTADLNFKGFSLVDLGDISWAGRRLDFYTNVKERSVHLRRILMISL